MVKNLIIIVLLLIVGFAAYNKLISWKYTTEEKIKTVVEYQEKIIRDTVEIPTPKIAYRDRYRDRYYARKLPLADQNPKSNKIDSIEVNLPIHVYTDKITKDSSTFEYNIEVEGYLRHFDYTFNTYTKTVQTTKEITHTKHRIIDLYAIAGFKNVPYVGLDVAVKKYKVGYRLSLDRNAPGTVHSFELGYRFWDW